MHTQYITAKDDTNQEALRPIDDSNIDLVLFFQQFEQLLELDLKSKINILLVKQILFSFEYRSIVFIN